MTATKKTKTKNTAPAPLLTAVALARALSVPRTFPRLWALQGAPFTEVATKNGTAMRFTMPSMEKWFAKRGDPTAAHLDTITRESPGMTGTWQIFRREGWCAFPCKWCAQFPVETERRRRLGDYVQARIESRKTIHVGKRAGEVVTNVRLRCWCTGKMLLVPLEFAPEAARKLLDA